MLTYFTRSSKYLSKTSDRSETVRWQNKEEQVLFIFAIMLIANDNNNLALFFTFSVNSL